MSDDVSQDDVRMDDAVERVDAERDEGLSPSELDEQPEGDLEHEGNADDGELSSAESAVELDHEESAHEENATDSLDAASAGDPTLREALGALLFVSPRPLTTAALAEYCEAGVDEVEDTLASLKADLQTSSMGYELVEVAGAWQFRTSVVCRSVVTKLIPTRARRLSKAAAETLSIVAYKQPVPRSEIEAIRGVDALPTIKTLLDARLIRVIGREDTPGQPALYGTTATFLEKFGLRDLAELPTTREIVELAEEPGEDSPADDESAVESSIDASAAAPVEALLFNEQHDA